MGLALTLALTSHAIAKPTPPSNHVHFQKMHMLILKCANSETTHMKSRLAVLQTDHSPTSDYAIVTGHGLPLQKPCYVQDFYGQRKPVDVIDYAKDFAVGTNNDWAIIRFEKMETKNLIRYPLSPITQHIKDFNSAHVKFAQARGLPNNAQNCRLFHQETPSPLYNLEQYSLFHDCQVVSGQSGSPLTYKIEGQDYLVGLHIGTLRFLRSPQTGRPQLLGHIALFDEIMVQDIKTMIENTQK